jgi:aspartate kinase
MIVAKFGGAVLQTADGVRQVRQEILSLEAPLLVVVSAFAGITNLLERLAESAVAEPARALQLLAVIDDYHAAIAAELLPDDALEQWKTDVAPLKERLRDVVRGLGIVGELSPRTLDLVVHFGERFSSSILLASLRAIGRDAALCSAVELVITDEAHRFARPDIELTRERVVERLLPLLESHGCVVTEGYIARSRSGEMTTMGRESSDYSATLLGWLAGAREVRIYTGVAGVLTADPALISGALTIPTLGYAAARTLAELGAKILHPRTVNPVEEGGIPLSIVDMTGRGTRIGAEHPGDHASVVLLPEASVLSITLPRVDFEIVALLRQIASEIPVVWHHQFRRRLQIVTALPPSAALLRAPALAGATVTPVAVVSLVRERGITAADLETFFASITGCHPVALQGAIDDLSVSAALEPVCATEAARTLHRVFVQQTDVARH